MKISDKVKKIMDEKQLKKGVWEYADSDKLAGQIVSLQYELEHRLTNKAVSKARAKAERDFNRLFANMNGIENFDLMVAVYFQIKRGKRTSIHSLRKWVDLHKSKSRDELVTMFEESFQVSQMFDPNDDVAVFHESY